MTPTWPRLLCAGALLMLSQFAHAQYSWIDAKGTHVYSDQPPPPNTPASRILKSPRAAEVQDAQPAPPPAGAPAAPPPGAPAAAKSGPRTLADQEADYRKRMAQRDADDKKAADDAKRKAAQAQQCEAVRRSERTLQSGTRLSETNDKGEREYVSDDERARRLARARESLASCN